MPKFLLYFWFLTLTVLSFASSLSCKALYGIRRRHRLKRRRIPLERGLPQCGSLSNDDGGVADSRSFIGETFTIRDLYESCLNCADISTLVARVDQRCGSPPPNVIESRTTSTSGGDNDSISFQLVVEHSLSNSLVGCATVDIVKTTSDEKEGDDTSLLAVARGVRVDTLAVAEVLNGGSGSASIESKLAENNFETTIISGDTPTTKRRVVVTGRKSETTSNDSSSWDQQPSGQLLTALMEEVVKRAAAAGAQRVTTQAYPRPELSLVGEQGPAAGGRLDRTAARILGFPLVVSPANSDKGGSSILASISANTLATGQSQAEEAALWCVRDLLSANNDSNEIRSTSTTVGTAKEGGPNGWQRDKKGRSFVEYGPATMEKKSNSASAAAGLPDSSSSSSSNSVENSQQFGGLELPRSGELLLLAPAAAILILGAWTALLVLQAASSGGGAGVEVVTELPSSYLV